MSQSDRRPILVTGGTGRQGGSGRAVVAELIGRGQPVRALVRRPDERSERLAALGAEIVVGDYADYPSLVRALDGVASAYFCYPVGDGIAEAAGLFATAGRDRGLQRIVDLSLASTRPDSPTPQGRAQWVAEKIFEWAGIDGVHLRIAAFFMENVLRIDGDSIRRQGRIANAFGDHPLAWISGEDVGAIAAALLADPGLTSERVVMAGGVERMTFPQVAEAVASVVGKPIRYEELSPAVWREELIERARAGGEENVRGADHLTAQSVAIRKMPPLPVTPHVKDLVGREPIVFSRFLERRREDLMLQ